MLVFEARRPIALLRLEHGKAQALDVELVEALRAALADLATDTAVRGVVLTGTGSIFSAGVDLYRVVEGGADYVERFLPALSRLFLELFRFPKPAVAGINGHAIAGGYVLAAACDLRLALRERGKIGVPELTVGVPFPRVAIEILRFATSRAHLQDLVYRGRTCSPQEALERGLVDELTDESELLSAAREAASRLGAEPSARFRITKGQLRAPALRSVERTTKAEAAAVVAAWKSPETLAAIAAYLERLELRRPPR